MTEIDLDLESVPWSRAGSYLSLSLIARPADHPGGAEDWRRGLYLHDVSGRRLWRPNAIFRISALQDGEPVEPKVSQARPAHLILDAGEGSIEVAWESADTLRFRGHGAGLRLSEAVVDPFDSAAAFPNGPDEWRLQMGEDAHVVVTRLIGSLDVKVIDVPARAQSSLKVVDATPDAEGSFEIALTLYESGFSAPARRAEFDECISTLTTELDRWNSRYPVLPRGLSETGRLAGYVAWGALVAPRGLLARPGMLMSKNWMNGIFSWDHCFNALGLMRSDPDLAWDQFMLPFDHQGPQGALPDLVHDYARMWGFVKPPVHGWTLRKLARAGIVTAARLEEIYPKLAHWTDWWFSYRDLDGDGLCEYFHGCDSGQDNSTAFEAGFPAVGPDLAAFLVIQMDVLSDLAKHLGDLDGSARWTTRADTTLSLLLERLWDGERFRVLNAADGSDSRDSRSQIPFLPLVLGARLPEEVRVSLVSGLRSSGLITDFGIASESPDSLLYEPDGYWRGPIWAPTTYLLLDGLAACGEAALAREIAGRFLAMCTRSGFAENFDAISGRPQRDPAYTWSASVFWALACAFGFCEDVNGQVESAESP